MRPAKNANAYVTVVQPPLPEFQASSTCMKFGGEGSQSVDTNARRGWIHRYRNVLAFVQDALVGFALFESLK